MQNFVKSAKRFLRFRDFPIFKMAAVRHLGFWNFSFFGFPSVCRAKVHHYTKFHQNRSNGCRDIAFNVFQNGGRSPTWIYKRLIFWSAGKLQRTNVCYRAKFRKNWPNDFWDIAIFRFSRWPPSAILDFEIFQYLVFHQVGTAKMHHPTKFHQNRSNGCRDITFNVFQNGGRLPSWIC